MSNSSIENGARHRNKQFKEKKRNANAPQLWKIHEHSLKVEKYKPNKGKEKTKYNKLRLHWDTISPLTDLAKVQKCAAIISR